MTDLTAYEQALVERVARALCEGIGFDPDQPLYEDDDENLVWHEYTADAKAALSALGLIGPSRTAWLAPWEETDAMYDAGHAAFQDPKNHHGDVFGEVYYAMRDAHLKEGGA